MNTESLVNHFLLALPNQFNSYFEDTVTFMVRHGEEGAMGFVVNRPLKIKLSEILKEASLPTQPGEKILVMEGGPVDQLHPSILHSDDYSTAGTLSICSGISLTTEATPGNIFSTLEAISNNEGPSRYLVLLGYAGWSSGQLEGEIQENAWATCPAEASLIFDEPIEKRVERVAAAIGVDLKKLSPLGGLA